MIRPITRQDTENVMALALKLGMFDSAELDHVRETLAQFLAGDCDDLWFAAEEDALAGVLYCAPEPMTSGTWNVLMLLVDPDHHGKGHGSALMNHVEQRLRDSGNRLLIVETSGLDDFERARSFYLRCGYSQEARIKNFYTAGDDKIIYVKAI